MSSSPGPGRPGSAAGPAAVLDAVRRSALEASDALIQHVPDTGDHATGRAVDAFVEQACDALRALAEAVDDTLGPAGHRATPEAGPDASVGSRVPGGGADGADAAPPGWHW